MLQEQSDETVWGWRSFTGVENRSQERGDKRSLELDINYYSPNKPRNKGV
jgi:hypothetical protein